MLKDPWTYCWVMFSSGNLTRGGICDWMSTQSKREKWFINKYLCICYLCICILVYMYICVFVFFVFVYLHIWDWKPTREKLFIAKYMCICVFMIESLNEKIYVYLCIWIFVYFGICVYLYLSILIFVIESLYRVNEKNDLSHQLFPIPRFIAQPTAMYQYKYISNNQIWEMTTSKKYPIWEVIQVYKYIWDNWKSQKAKIYSNDR